MSGATDERCAVVTASARRLPALASGHAVVMLSNVMRHLPADDVLQRGRAALVRHVLHLDARDALEELAGQVLRRAVAARGERVLAGIRLHQRDELGDVLRRHARIDRRACSAARAISVIGTKSLHRIVGQALVQRRVDRVRADRAADERVAVRRRLRDEVRADAAAGAGPVLDDHGLAERDAAASRRPCARGCPSCRRARTARPT